MNLRLAVASADGFDDAMADRLDDYESSDLPPAQKAALRLADAYLSSPGLIDGELRDLVRRHFSDEQIAELVLDLAKWGTQKIAVALGLDAPVAPGRLGIIQWDDRGVSSIVVPD